MNTHLKIRKATLKDLQKLVKILTEATQYKFDHGDIAWGIEPYTKDEIKIPVKKGLIYIAHLNGEAVGTFQLVWTDEIIWGQQPPDAGYIHQVAIRDGHHGRDLGKQMIDSAAKIVKANGRAFLRLDFHPSNKGLKNYYELLGFYKKYQRKVTGRSMDYEVLLYEKPVE